MADSYIRGAIFTDIPTSGERPVQEHLSAEVAIRMLNLQLRDEITSQPIRRTALSDEWTVNYPTRNTYLPVK